VTIDRAWLFRVASDPKWGGGHVSRCRVLARALRRRGVDVAFWLDPKDGGWTESLVVEGFQVVDGKLAHSVDWEGLVIDGYDLLGRESIEQLGRIARPTVCLVDHLLPGGGVDLMLNAGATQTESGSLLSGMQYALVDAAFSRIPDVSHGPISRLLVTMGRTDMVGATARVVRGLAQVPFFDPAPVVTVVIGCHSPDRNEVAKMLEKYPGPFELFLDVPDMIGLFAQSDAVVVSGGVSLLECLAAGRPNVVVQTAPNQAGNVGQALEAGASLWGGDVVAWDGDQFVRAVESLIGSSQARQAMSAAGRRAVDARGADRVAATILELERPGAYV
jgi:UDP-2,4-diacetamido-2,4,6-trideoxy-beta-L-altropyranose hydrolase